MTNIVKINTHNDYPVNIIFTSLVNKSKFCIDDLINMFGHPLRGDDGLIEWDIIIHDENCVAHTITIYSHISTAIRTSEETEWNIGGCHSADWMLLDDLITLLKHVGVESNCPFKKESNNATLLALKKLAAKITDYDEQIVNQIDFAACEHDGNIGKAEKAIMDSMAAEAVRKIYDQLPASKKKKIPV